MTIAYRTEYISPIRKLILSSDGEGLTGVWLSEQKYLEATLKDKEICEKDDLPIFEQTKEWLDRYFSGKRPKIQELVLHPEGSPFRQRVWAHLCAIPYGETTTYGAIAGKVALEMNRPHMSAQAVGGAVGHNPISIIIPCHRVVGTQGSLTGYAGGLDVKKWLLSWEGVDMSGLSEPRYTTAP